MLAVLAPVKPCVRRLRGQWRRDRSGETAPVDRAGIWIEAFAADITGGAARKPEALVSLCEVLGMEPQAAKSAERVAEICRDIDSERLRESARSDTPVAAPPSIRANLVTVIRRLRDAKEPERALAFADVLETAGDGAHANRERMLTRLDSGDAGGALALCETLVRDGHGDLIPSVAEWMLVRISRPPHDEQVAALAAFMLSRRLAPLHLLEKDATVGGLVSALAAVRARGERMAAAPEDVRAAVNAAQALAAIEAAIREVEAPSASVKLAHIRVLGVLDRFELAFDAMAAYCESHAISRGTAAIFSLVMDRYLRARHSAGTRMDLVAPLLDEAIFADYLPRIDEEEAAIWNAWPFARNIETALAPRPPVSIEPSEPAALTRRRDPRTRVLVICSNWKFISPLIERMESEVDSDLVFRTLDFRSLTLVDPAARPNGFYFFNRDASATAWKGIRTVAPDFAELVDWADVVMVEWANQPAVVLSQLLPSDKRLVVRLHSYEAFSNWHYFIDWTRVDEAAFVADHVRSIFFAQNRLARRANLKTSIVPNRQDFEDPIPRRDAAARRTICMLGWATANKDPIFALEALQILRRGGEDWRLRLVGSDWRPQAGALEAEYRARFETMIRDADLSGAVEIVPHTDAPLTELGRAGYVISASHREGTHESILEGLAVGCLPVIRDWPMVAAFGGARSQYAAFTDRIVQTPEEAAQLVLTTPWTHKHGHAVRERARTSYGPQNSVAAFRRFLKG